MYTCDKCGYTVNDKNRYERHLNRKFPCKPKTEKDNKTEEKKVESQMNPFESQMNPYEKAIDESANVCEYCGKVFSFGTNLTRHLKKSCVIFKSKLKKERDKEIDSLKMEVKQLQSDLINKPNNVINNINNGKIDNKTINVNGYGNETIGHLNGDYFKTLIGAPYTAVPKLIKDIHCNPDVPENHNLRKKNKRDKYIEYYDGKEWKIEDKKKQLDHLVDMTFTILENTVNIEKDINSEHLERFSLFRDKYYEDRDKVKTKNMSEAEIMIINNSK